MWGCGNAAVITNNTAFGDGLSERLTLNTKNSRTSVKFRTAAPSPYYNSGYSGCRVPLVKEQPPTTPVMDAQPSSLHNGNERDRPYRCSGLTRQIGRPYSLQRRTRRFGTKLSSSRSHLRHPPRLPPILLVAPRGTQAVMPSILFSGTCGQV